MHEGQNGNHHDSSAMADILVDCRINEIHYGAFKAVRDVHVPIQMEAGVNVVVLETTSDSPGPNVDSVTIG